MSVNAPYAPERTVTDLAQCYFYHSMEIPEYGLVEGQWDLREGVSEYCGGVDFAGKRVLEVGTASGFLCFHMERAGAEVVAYDLSDEDSWDLVPFPELDWDEIVASRRAIMRKINNGWWLCHRALSSRARVVYGSVYDVPATIGPVDVATFCSVLLHLRDPFLALHNGLRLTRDVVVVTDLLATRAVDDEAPGRPALPFAEFVPDFRTQRPFDTWWFLNPPIVVAWVAALGFEDTTVTRHLQHGPLLGEREFFTVVGRRTKGRALGD
jgi:methyltransferase family protein